jgi:hypothetical protein
VRACERPEVIEDFMDTLAEDMIPAMMKKYPGQDPRSQLEGDCGGYDTLGEHYDRLLVIDKTLARLCEKLTQGRTKFYLLGSESKKAAAVMQEFKQEAVNSVDVEAQQGVDGHRAAGVVGRDGSGS